MSPRTIRPRRRSASREAGQRQRLVSGLGEEVVGSRMDDRTSQAAPEEPRQDAGAADRRLDMELEQTFPASDPIPWIHEVGRSASKTVDQS